MNRLVTADVRLARSPLESYLREINATPLLNAREERELADRIALGDPAARDHLVRANLRLVVNLARGYAGKGLPLQDLVEEGNLGLMRAVEGFDPSWGTRFSTYAAYWIKQSIKRALINTGKTIRLPSYMVDLIGKWRRAAAELQEELGRTPTKEEIAFSLKLSAKKLKIIEKAIRVYNATAQGDGPETPLSLDEIAMDGRSPAPQAALEKADDLRQVLGLLETMDPREAAVLRLRFGLGGEAPLTLQEVGNRLGLTRERVRQIEREALDKLRTGVESD
jgi:RNA polymerase primary sigma factor